MKSSNINIILLNNKIYGLTKGQYSPTSNRGAVTKSSPYGTVEDPFIPAELTFGARGNFFARTIDVDLVTAKEVMVAAAKHKGASVVEVLQNCVIFNDQIHKHVADKEFRAERTIHLKHGEKMLFGKNMDKGLVLDGLNLKVVKIGENGVTLEDILVHDETTQDNFLHLRLAMMDGHELPLAVGVIRSAEAPCYDEEVKRQMEEIRNKRPDKTLRDLLLSEETWEVK